MSTVNTSSARRGFMCTPSLKCQAPVASTQTSEAEAIGPRQCVWRATRKGGAFYGIEGSWHDPIHEFYAAEAAEFAPRRGPAATDGVTNSADRKSTRLNSSHGYISYAVFCLKKKKH